MRSIKEDYVKILVQTPARVVLALALAFGGGAGYVHVLGYGDGSQQAQHDLDSCLVAYAEARSLANQQTYDIAKLSQWAEKSIRALPELQRMEAFNSAPRVFSSAQGVGLSH